MKIKRVLLATLSSMTLLCCSCSNGILNETTPAPEKSPITSDNIVDKKEEAVKYSFADTETKTIEAPEILPKTLINKDFNYFGFTYTSQQPIYGVISYKSNEKNLTEDFYLEAGDNKTFKSYIDNYFNGARATLISVAFTPLVQCTSLSVSGFFTENREVYDEEICYMSNDRYKIGVKLSWGGGISYIEDLKDGNNSLGNLINNADTGRLVQQSYYGISDEPYVCGYYNDVKWSYNPVQGGNLAGEASKIVDFNIDKLSHSIYVKCRPRDWAKSGCYSYAYMENTYTIKDNCIYVDNRYIDFGDYRHNMSTQELPAFYTISYLSNFVYYNGDKPWENDTYTKESNLNFWGDKEYQKDCTFTPNTEETWCAWIDNKNYGIGLFVPNTNILFGGRFCYNGTKNPNDSPTNYVAPLRRITINRFVPIQYSYIITAGSIDEIRGTFMANKDFTKNEGLVSSIIASKDPKLLTFESSADLSLFSTLNSCAVSYEDNSAKFVANSTDPYAGISYLDAKEQLDADKYKKITITYKTTGSKNSISGELFYCSGEVEGATAGISKRFNYKVSSDYTTVEIDLSNVLDWSGRINYLRFDFDLYNDAALYIKSIQLS